MMLRLPRVAALSLAVVACRPATVIEPAAPTRRAMPRPDIPAETSFVVVPIKAPRSAVEERVTRAVFDALRPQEQITEARHNRSDPRDWTRTGIRPHGDLRARLIAGGIRVSGGLEYNLEYRDVRLISDHYIRCPSGGRGDWPRMYVDIRIRPRIDSTWALKFDSRIEDLRRYSGSARDDCQVRIFPIRSDVTEEVRNGMEPKIELALAQAKADLASMPLYREAAKLWTAARTPIALSSVDGGVTLLLDPLAVELLTPFDPSNVLGIRPETDTVRFVLGVTLLPRVSLGTTPKPVGPALPPNLVRTSKREPGISVVLDVGAGLDSLSVRLDSALRGKRIGIGGGSRDDRHVTIADAALLEIGGDSIFARIRFRGSARGALYVKGRPVYDTLTGDVRLADLEYDVQSRNVLASAAQWLAPGRLLRMIDSATTFPLRAAVDSARTALEQQLDRDLAPGVHLSARISDLTPRDVAVSDGRLRMRFLARGQASVNVDPLKLAPPSPAGPPPER